MIAPPSLLYANTEASPNIPARKPTKGNLGQKLGFGQKPTLFGAKKSKLKYQILVKNHIFQILVKNHIFKILVKNHIFKILVKNHIFQTLVKNHIFQILQQLFCNKIHFARQKSNFPPKIQFCAKMPNKIAR